jgi:hypothetical protein
VSSRSKTVALFDHLVGAGEDRRGHVEIKRLGMVEIDHHFESGRLLDWKIARLGTAHDLVDWDADRRHRLARQMP